MLVTQCERYTNRTILTGPLVQISNVGERGYLWACWPTTSSRATIEVDIEVARVLRE